VFPGLDGAPPSPDAIDGSTVDGPSAGAKSGLIIVEEIEIFGTALTVELGAFYDGTGTGGTSRIEGPCTIRTGTSTNPPKVLAGTLTFTAGSDVVAIDPDTNNEYSADQTGVHYAPGTSIEVAATGASVPAFSHTLQFPAAITVTSPTPSFFFQLSKSAGLSASWTGTAPVWIVISQDGVFIQCRLEGVTSATIPASTLNDLAITTGDPDAYVQISPVTYDTFDSGPFRIEAEAVGVGFVAQATVQP